MTCTSCFHVCSTKIKSEFFWSCCFLPPAEIFFLSPCMSHYFSSVCVGGKLKSFYCPPNPPPFSWRGVKMHNSKERKKCNTRVSRIKTPLGFMRASCIWQKKKILTWRDTSFHAFLSICSYHGNNTFFVKREITESIALSWKYLNSQTKKIPADFVFNCY